MFAAKETWELNMSTSPFALFPYYQVLLMERFFLSESEISQDDVHGGFLVASCPHYPTVVKDSVPPTQQQK